MKKLYFKNLYIASHAPFAQTHFQKYILFYFLCGFPNYIYILVRTTYISSKIFHQLYLCAKSYIIVLTIILHISFIWTLVVRTTSGLGVAGVFDLG